MRLSTIWTVHNMSTIERLRRTQVWSIEKVASKLPKTIKYAVLIDELDKHSNSDTSTTEKVLNDRYNK